LLKLADRKRKLKNVLFLFIGNGTEKQKLKKQAKNMKLENVRFMDFIPRTDYNELVKICNVGFISLHPDVPIPNIPSKTLSYFNAKLAVLSVVDPITDYGDYMLNQFNAGLSSMATDFESLSANFDTLYNNPDLCKEMGENGYKSLITHFSPELAYKEIMKAYSNEN
jgi:glycosyltransferase involved in cell wall biosynthesis